jgi:hypothetical protein
MNSFFEKNIKGNVKCARSGFYKRMLRIRIKQERLKMMNLDSNDKRVDVVTIESPQLSQTKSPPHSQNKFLSLLMRNLKVNKFCSF